MRQVLEIILMEKELGESGDETNASVREILNSVSPMGKGRGWRRAMRYY